MNLINLIMLQRVPVTVVEREINESLQITKSIIRM
jgi:hypothetical protein